MSGRDEPRGTDADLARELRRIDGKGFGAYHDVEGCWRFREFRLCFDRAQSDPFAPPSRFRVIVRTIPHANLLVGLHRGLPVSSSFNLFLSPCLYFFLFYIPFFQVRTEERPLLPSSHACRLTNRMETVGTGRAVGTSRAVGSEVTSGIRWRGRLGCTGRGWSGNGHRDENGDGQNRGGFRAGKGGTKWEWAEGELEGWERKGRMGRGRNGMGAKGNRQVGDGKNGDL